MKVYKIDDRFYMEDGEIRIELEPNKDYYVKLPNNSCNRVWVSCAKIDKAPNQSVDYGDNVKTPRVLGPRAESKKLMDYATEDEKQLIADILQKCKERRELEKPQPMTELEKAEAKLAKLNAKVAELKAQAALQ